MQKNYPRKKINRNLMQLSVRVAKQPVKIVEAGRGSGKSTVLADEMEDVVHDMPRSTNFIQCNTFQQALTRTLPSTIASLESLGYINGLHYTTCKRPPKSWKWPEPYEPQLDYSRSIVFYTGAIYVMLSQDTSSRGINTASGIADEFALLNPEKFQAETLATIRSQKERFKNCRRYRNQTYVSSIPRTQEGKFMYVYEEEARKEPDKILYLRASSYINKHNLPEGWFEDQKRIMSKYEFDIEIANIRPRALQGGFYPLFNDKDEAYGGHTYTAYNNDYLAGIVDNNGYKVSDFEHLDCLQDGDIIRGQPLDIALDYGKFSCIVTGQESVAMRTFSFISAFSSYSKEGKVLLTEDIVQEWCLYYAAHKVSCNTVHFWYDQTAMGTDGRSAKTYVDFVVDVLRANGWNVIMHYYGKAPVHNDKYNFWAVALRNTEPKLPRFRWNKYNSKYAIESINNAEAREATTQGTKGVEKVKTDEKNKSLDQRYTTHFSDACDMLAYFKYANALKDTGIWLPTSFI